MPQERTHIGILDPLFENTDQSIVIDAVEKLPHIALERPTLSRIVAALGSQHIAHRFHPLVRTLAYATRKRRRDKRRFENRIENSKNRMMQYSVPHSRLMYPTTLWIMHPKSMIRPVLVCLVAQIAMQLENIPLDMMFKISHIRFIAFVTLEDLPRRKEILCGRY